MRQPHDQEQGGELAILRADPSDVSEILRLQRIAFQSEAERYQDWTIPPLTQTLEEIKEEFRRKVFVKATLDGKLVGSARASLESGVCYIGRVIVDPVFQGRGIGKRVMAAIEAEFPLAERFELFTGDRCDRNLAFYRGLGYQAFKTVQVAPHMALVYMEKRPKARVGDSCSSTSS